MRYKSAALFAVATIMIFIFVFSKTYADQEPREVKILFTHDMHDHLLPNKGEYNGSTVWTGGYSRLKTVIDEEKSGSKNIVLVDAGDYSMGDLFQSLYSTDAPELRIMGQMGYDVTTLGNHEFEFKDTGLTRHLYSAKNSSDKLPEIVSSNIVFPGGDKMTKSSYELQQAMKAYGVKDYTILNRGGIRIGIFGLMGKDAEDCITTTEVSFDNVVESSKRVVKKLKQEGVDLIICLSHSGTWEKASKSEDEILAKKVPDIDVIVSGHTHTLLKMPIIHGNAVIGSCGEYGNNLGVIELVQIPGERWSLKNYHLKHIDQSITEDSGISQSISKFKTIVQKEYLNYFDMQFDEVLCRSPFSFIATEQIGKKLQEDTLGNLISDGYIYSVKQAEGKDYEPVAVAIVPVGTMRGSFVEGDITVQDAFISSCLGIGPDGKSGYPLISVYLTGKELKNLCELDASISPMMSYAQLYMSGVDYTFNPNRMILNRVTEAHLQKPDGTQERIDDKKLYRVVSGLYNAQMLATVGPKSFGLLPVVPKTKEGKPIKDFDSYIIYSNSGGHTTELKEWLATARYLQSFPKTEGVPQIPYYYNTLQGRKIIDNTNSLSAILGNPNSIAVRLYLVVLAVVVVITAAIVIIVRLVRKKGKNKAAV
ncbi:bifunctional metallophosphatase/5'-nucleotidase [Ruminiclostridium papyrosolvens]|uniref:Metallophosphoesterase n=1 Tax=Ruminiclostridium papyrosolvens C7 TaxID=1330534 RepID=U4R379_9FIRM|nr:bifunctional UDP-sugar hydrolase/5'-nucleotidase [Ruminiclostridium papyrosolvens]EPR12179.1 metallophosphoesterase [Ruminiclostridium papyrosolvens C7]